VNGRAWCAEYGSMAIAMVKVTFTLDEATVARLNEAAARRKIPKSQAVREAIEDFSVKEVRIGEADRKRRLDAYREFLATVPPRPEAEVKKEIAEIRRARRHGGRLHRAE
jgi:predicted transcriptional regulator